MAFILDVRSRACCLVPAFWKPDFDKYTTYATIDVSQGSGKRSSPPSSTSSGDTRPSLTVTCWSSSIASCAPSPMPQGMGHSSSFVLGSRPHPSKPFRKEFTVKNSLGEGRGVVRILDVGNVFCEQECIEKAYILLCVGGRRKKHILYMFSIECDEVFSIGEVPTTDIPLKAIIISGPSVVVSFSRKVCLFDFKSEEDRVLATSQTCTRYCIGRTSREDIAVICTITGASSLLTKSRVSIQAVDSTGRLLRPVNLQGTYDVDVDLNSVETYVTFDDDLFYIFGLSDDLYVFDVNSARIVSHIAFPRNVSSVRFAIFAEKLFFISSSDSTNSGYELFFASTPESKSSPTGSNKESSVPVITAKSLFSDDKCRFSSHSHFYAEWRDRLLQISDHDGVCCNDSVDADKSNTFDERNVNRNSFQSHNSFQHTASPNAVAGHLRRRFDLGIKELMGIIERYDEKRRMLFYLVRYISDVLRGPDVAPQAGVLDVRLRRIATRTERIANITDASDDEQNSICNAVSNEDGPFVRLCVTGQSHQGRTAPFVRPLSASYRVDDSERFVIVKVKVQMLPKKSSEEIVENPALLGLLLIMSVDPCAALTYRATLDEVVPGEEAVQVAASIPLADILTGVTGLRQPIVGVHIEKYDVGVQQLGSFDLPALLANDHKTSKIAKDNYIHGFEQFIHLVIRGVSPRQLRLISKLEHGVKVLSSTEGIAYVRFRAIDGVQMARFAEKLKIAAGKDAEFQQVPPLEQSSLTVVEEGLLTLRQEVNLFRGVVSRNDAVGCSLEDIIQILDLQRNVQNLFGIIKECILGLDDTP